ncbi:MAG: DCC1-like thiol-disulfide oxidoreductase family protein, partial [Planctomycetota bacterium]
MLRRRVRRYDPKKRLTFIACQADDLEERALHLVSKEQAKKSVYVIDTNQRVYKGSRAVGEVMKQLTQPWKFLGTLLAFPLISWMTQPFYLFVA